MQKGNDPVPPLDSSDHNLSNELRELAEEEVKSGVVTEQGLKSQENVSRVEKETMSNTMLAHSELIQLPLQQFMQQQTLRLSSPPAINNPNTLNQYPQQPAQNNTFLRASLPPPNSQNNNALRQPSQVGSTWIAQPVTTQARVESGNRTFIFPNGNVPPSQPVPRPPNQIQQGQVQLQSRPSSSSPNRITFNYQVNQRNVSPPPTQPPQPIVRPQPQPIPQPQPQPPNQIIVQPIPQPQPLPPNNNAVFILPTQPPHPQVVLWQQRYFVILQKFHFYYSRLQIIHKKCIYLDQAILQTKKPEQLQLLRHQSQDLLTLITSTEQQLTETIHRNRELLTEATNWKQKYDQLSRAYESLKQSQTTANKDLAARLQQQTRKIVQLQSSYNSVVKQNEEESSRNRKLQQQLAILNEQLRSNLSNSNNHKEFELQLAELSKIISDKNDVIVTLRKALEAKSSSPPEGGDLQLLAEENSSYQQLVTELRQENQKLSSSIKKNNVQYQAKISKYQQLIYEYQANLQAKDAQSKKLQALLDSKNAELNTSRQNIPQNSPRNPELEIENRRLKHELTVYEQSHSSDIKIYNSKIQQLVDKLKMVGNERDSTVANLQEKTNLLQSDLNRKDGTIRNLRDRILELQEEKRIRDLDRKYEPKKTEGGLNQSQENNSLKRELNDKINEVEELEAQLSQYKRIANEYEDTLRAKKHEINALKRDMEEKSQGVLDSSQLNEQLRKKSEETHLLQEKVVELEKFRNQNELLRQENIHLNESVRKKHVEVTEATDKIYLLEKRVRELELMGDNSPKIVQLAQEYELMQSAVAKKDQEIIKLRQNNQLLQSNINELELDLEQFKTRLNTGEKHLQSERGQLKAKLSVLQLKVVEYERKISGLQQVRSIMTEQINTLTSQIHIKFQTTQRIELQLKQERARSKALETEIDIQNGQIAEANSKVREWERKYQNITKELQSQLDKKKDLSNTKKNEVFNLNNKCVELEAALKAKELKIKELEKSVESLSAKIRTFDHNLEQIQYLKHKITEYQHKISYQNHRFTSTRLPDLQPTQIFERKVIYQLKVENEQLRKQLGLAPKPQGKEANIPQKENNQNVNQRLNDFNKKLEQIIGENMVQYNLSGDQLYKKFQRDRRLLIQRHNEQITQLKVKIHELEGNTHHHLPKKYNNINQIFNEQLDFYREKNQELELRVESHIKVNRELKESLEVLLRSQSGEHSLSFYKEQVEKSNDTIVNLQKQLKKVNEELKKLKEDAARTNSKQYSDPNSETETKLIQQTRRVNQLTLEISLLEKERVSKEESLGRSEGEIKRLKAAIDQLKASRDELQRQLKEKENFYQDELTKLSNKLRFNQSEIDRLNEILGKRQESESSESKALRVRIAELQEESKRLKARTEELIIAEEKYQREITKHENQIHILMGENQRLKEIADSAGKRHREGDSELQSLRLMIGDFEGKIKSLESLRDSFGYRENQLQQEIGRLNNQIKLLNAQIERLTEFTQKKVSDKDLEITRLKELLNKGIDESAQLSDQLRDLKLLSFKSNETAQEMFNLKEEINSLKITLNMKHTESENRLREIYELNDRLRFIDEQFNQAKRASDSKVAELQAIIVSLQSQMGEYKKMKESGFNDSNMRVQTLQEQLRALRLQRQQEISSYTSRITLLEIQLRESGRSLQVELEQLRQSQASLLQKNSQLSYTYEQLAQQYEYLKVEFQKREEIIGKLQAHLEYLQSQLNLLQQKSGSHDLSPLLPTSKYSIEFLRSILIEIDALLSEDGSLRPELWERVSGQIGLGLSECVRWGECLSL